MKKSLKIFVLLAIISQAYCLSFGLGSMRLPLLGARRNWQDAIVRSSAEPEIVEVVRWRQPVCVVPGKDVQPCLTSLRKFQKDYESNSDKGSEEIGTKSNGKKRSGVLSPEIVDKFDVENIDSVNLDSSEEDMGRSFDGSMTLNLRSSTPEIENTRSNREGKYLVMSSFGKASEVVHDTPPAIYVTKVLNSPVTATLVANNCFPDIGVPLCDSYQETITIYKDPASTKFAEKQSNVENTDESSEEDSDEVSEVSTTTENSVEENNDTIDFWDDPSNPNFDNGTAEDESQRPNGLLIQAIQHVVSKPGILNAIPPELINALANNPAIIQAVANAGNTGNGPTNITATEIKPQIVQNSESIESIEVTPTTSRPGLISALLNIQKPAILNNVFNNGFNIFNRSTTTRPAFGSTTAGGSSVERLSGGLFGQRPVIQSIQNFIHRPQTFNTNQKPEFKPILVVEPTVRPGIFGGFWKPHNFGIFNRVTTSTVRTTTSTTTSITSKPIADDPPAEDSPAVDPPAEDTPTDDFPAEDTPTEDSPAVDPPAEDTPTDVSPTDVSPAEDTPTNVSPAEDTPTDVSPAEDTPAVNPPAEDTPTDISPAEDSPGVNPPAEDTPTNVSPAEDSPAEDTPAVNPLAEDTPTDVSPAEDSPAVNPPAEDTPAVNPLAEDTPTDVSPAVNPPAEDTPTNVSPAEDSPTDDSAAEDAPTDDSAAEDTPTDDSTAEDPPADEMDSANENTESIRHSFVEVPERPALSDILFKPENDISDRPTLPNIFNIAGNANKEAKPTQAPGLFGGLFQNPSRPNAIDESIENTKRILGMGSLFAKPTNKPLIIERPGAKPLLVEKPIYVQEKPVESAGLLNFFIPPSDQPLLTVDHEVIKEPVYVYQKPQTASGILGNLFGSGPSFFQGWALFGGEQQATQTKMLSQTGQNLNSPVVQQVSSTIGDITESSEHEKNESVAVKITNSETSDPPVENEDDESVIDDETIEDIVEAVEEGEIDIASTADVGTVKGESETISTISVHEETGTVDAESVEQSEATDPIDNPAKTSDAAEVNSKNLADEVNTEITAPINIVETPQTTIVYEPSVESSEASELSVAENPVTEAEDAITVKNIIQESNTNFASTPENIVNETDNSEEESAIDNIV